MEVLQTGILYRWYDCILADTLEGEIDILHTSILHSVENSNIEY